MTTVLIVHDFAKTFGHGRYVVELSSRLVTRLPLEVWAHRFTEPAPAGLPLRRIPAWRLSALTSILSFLAGAEFLRVWRKPDVIHAQGLTCWGADIITAHVCNEARYMETAAEPVRQRVFPAIIVPFERRFYKQARARFLIAVSRRVAKEINDCYGWNRPSAVIYHGIDTAEFSPSTENEQRVAIRRKLQLPPSRWLWLFVGESAKGLAEVIRQMPRFREAVLLVVTRSDREPYRRIARECGVEDRVVFHGPLRRLTEIYQAADLFIYPSRYDTFGMVVAEAMATELPVIVGKDIGAAEWIEPERNGLLCDPKDPESLRVQLEKLRADRGFARALGMAARETARKYTWDACAAATLEVYREVLAGKQKEREWLHRR